MGTFRIQAQFVDSQSGITSYAVGAGGVAGAPSDADLKTIVNRFPFDAGYFWSSFAVVGGEISLFPDDEGIFLDGSITPVNSGQLPLGFNILSAQVEMLDAHLGAATYKLFNGAFESANNVTSFAYPPPVTLAGVLITNFGVRFVDSTGSNNGSWLIITGTYDIVAVVTQTPPPASLSVRNDELVAVITPGAIATITSSASNPDLTEVTNIKLTRRSDGSIINVVPPYLTQTTTSLTFTFPPAIKTPGEIVDVVITVFSGEEELNPVTILFADASGIYTLVEGKRSDTLYIDAPNDDTVEVKIPDPFIKTGFIGG